MGSGYFDGQKLHFVVSAEFDLTDPDFARWTGVLERMSADLHTATFGQVQVGTVWFADRNRAIADADVLLIDLGGTPGESSATQGGFGEPLRLVRLVDDVFKDPRIAAHEFAHHVWNLGDEYAKPSLPVTVDRSVTPADSMTVPTTGGLVPNELVGGLFYILFPAGQLGRAKVVSQDATTLTLQAPGLPDLVNRAINEHGNVQPVTVCGNPAGTAVSYCVMEDRISVTVVDFCDASNHATDTSTVQELTHGESCWATILSTPGFTQLVPPPGPAVVPSPDPITIVHLEDRARVALVVDVSGSMAGEKLRYAKAGIAYWLENVAGTGELLAVVAFSTGTDVILPLTEVGPGFDAAAVGTAVENLVAAGFTNIRDGVRAGIDEIVSAAGVADAQAVVLLTDGQHNRPVGTTVSEVQGDLQRAHVKLAAIGLGPQDDLDMEELYGIASVTNGFSAFVDTDDDPGRVQSALVDAYQRIFGELLELEEFEVVPPPPAAMQDIFPALEPLFATSLEVPLGAVAAAIGTDATTLTDPAALAAAGLGDVFTVRTFLVESGCESINATIDFGHADRFHIWLVDPQGREALDGGSAVRVSATETHPYRFCMVNRPAAGRWSAVVLRRPSVLAAGNRALATVRLTVGARHPGLTAVARTRKAVFAPGEPVAFEARAHWRAALTGLAVTADVRDAHGAMRRIRLEDGDLLSDSAGRYTGEFLPLKPGRHTAVVRIANAGRARRADGGHRAAHASHDGPVSILARIRHFRRVVPLTFDVLPV
jgi:uncharacterized protein YegL